MPLEYSINFSFQKLSWLKETLFWKGLVIRQQQKRWWAETSASLNIQLQPDPPPTCLYVGCFVACCIFLFFSFSLFWTFHLQWQSIGLVLRDENQIKTWYSNNMTFMWILYLRLHICRSSQLTLPEGHMWNLQLPEQFDIKCIKTAQECLII